MKINLKKPAFLTNLLSKEKVHSERYTKAVAVFNKYSILFHAVISCGIIFLIECFSRRSFFSACNFVGGHTLAFLYNAFIIFASLTLVYLFRRRAFARIIISCFWLILGIINGCVLSNRVTPFGYTDLKCVSDLLTMTNTNYFTASQAILVVIGAVILIAFLILFFLRGPKYEGKVRWLVAAASIALCLFVGIPLITTAAQKTNVVASYFSNIAQGYENYGFVYGFSSSVVDRGMKKPADYSKDTIEAIETNVASSKTETTLSKEEQPNIICILLESFCDPDEIKFLSSEEDPIPTFHKLEKNFSTGYCTVPVVGAGTSNSEFEVLTGMSMQYFGVGEYPHKTILKEIDGCESSASDLASIGYGTHVVHNNGGNFYSRVNAFSKMGFDTFQSKEMMDITDWTPNGSWAEDDILVNETIKALDSTPNQADYVYTITVGTHGDYPTVPVIDMPKYQALGCSSEETTNQWTYYINQLHKTDEFIRNLTDALSKRSEKTIVVMFGDHLPTMGLTDDDMKSGDIYKTKYITWNNFGLSKQDKDLYSYQLMANVLNQVGIHEGTIMNYHQTQENSETYYNGFENLQYDILYGKHYAFGETQKYPATDIEMGIEDVVITDMRLSADSQTLLIYGKNFTNWSYVYVNGEKCKTTYLTGGCISIKAEDLEDGDEIVVKQLGSSNTEFRASAPANYQVAE